MRNKATVATKQSNEYLSELDSLVIPKQDNNLGYTSIFCGCHYGIL
jgi:hypothetical protein